MKLNIDEIESHTLASYAMHSKHSKGRKHPESSHSYRGPYQRDRDRVVHSSAYRRLAHKTQVFTGEMGDYHRSRLTHTLEVASIARTIGRVLRLNEDLIETLALMHDIGHPPFGHAGEEVLNQCTSDYGGFNHNSHAIRIVTLLEHRYPRFPGLNLSREVLSGQERRAKKNNHNEQPLLEVQVVDAADSIAYDSHDADDALELGLIEENDLLELTLWSDAAERVKSNFANLDDNQLRRAVIHQLIETLVSDLIQSTVQKLKNQRIKSPREVTQLESLLVSPSHSYAEQKSELEAFLFDRVYRHPTVLAERSIASEALEKMFSQFCKNPELLPSISPKDTESEIPRTVCDFLAGMTDRHALELYQSLEG